ncbi:MAG: NAD-dependent epimerase/dehydratase family protein [Verrucomicrobia bacterium]|nr:NAD-dependent epimerase/dehydratase family protein [Verrucomicrobiota bacterium]MDE3098680.1 NAD-dependent epimerase/dehydratase family protein [Verrucomicrobiota bacterium]
MRPVRHVIVTGGAGFIGSHLVERLLASGKRVIVIDDFSTGSMANLRAVQRHPRLKIIRSRISGCARLPAFAANAEFIFHLAATVGVELVVQSALRVLEAGFHETQILLRAAARHSTPVLLTSTSEVYGKSARKEFSEEDDLIIGPPNQSRWSYACSKLTDEFLALAYAREAGLPVIIVRLFNTVGPRQTGRYGMVLPRFIAAAKANRPLDVFGDGAQTRCFCLVDDAVEALIRLQRCGSASGRIFNVGGAEEVSILDLARLVIKTLGSKSRVRMVPYSKAYPGHVSGPDHAAFDDMRRRKPLLEKLRGAAGFTPRTPLRDIIRLTAQS